MNDETTRNSQNCDVPHEENSPPKPYYTNSGAPGYQYPPPVKPRKPYAATKADALFTFVCFVLGFIFVRWVLFSWQGWSVTAFTVLFATAVLCYAGAKKVKPAKNSWFWFAIMLICGLCYCLWPINALQPIFSFLLFGTAVLWCASVFGMLMEGKAGNLLGLDAVNLLAITPFANIDAPVRSLAALSRKDKSKKIAGRKLVSIMCGVVICILFLAIVLPILASADNNIFGKALKNIAEIIANNAFWDKLRAEGFVLFIEFLFGIPVAWYICGLIVGGAHRRYSVNIPVTSARKAFEQMRIAPNSTLLIVMWAACVTYVIFIACQIPQFFSAFGGNLPAGETIFSQYARSGFFELCTIAGINLALLSVSNTFCKVPTAQNRHLRIANIVLCLLTLLVIATALSKMGLYISVYGYTQKRVLTSVFMVFLAIVCVAAIVRQFKQFSVVRLVAVCGSVMLCALCLCNLDGFVVRQNINLYQSGRLEHFDAMAFMQSGPEGAMAVWQFYTDMQNDDGTVQIKEDEMSILAYVLNLKNIQAQNMTGTREDTIAYARVRALNMKFDEEMIENGEDLYWEAITAT